MSKAREYAEQAVNNIWLLLAQRIAVLIFVPGLLAAGASYITLRDRVTLAEAGLVVATQRVTTLETTTGTLRNDINIQAGNITRLQTQREGDAELGRRISEMRGDVQRLDTRMGETEARLNGRLDQMMTPPRRGAP